MRDSDCQDVWSGLCGGVVVSVHTCPRACTWACMDVCAASRKDVKQTEGEGGGDDARFPETFLGRERSRFAAP